MQILLALFLGESAGEAGFGDGDQVIDIQSINPAGTVAADIDEAPAIRAESDAEDCCGVAE